MAYDPNIQGDNQGNTTIGNPTTGNLTTLNGTTLITAPVAPFGAPICEIDQVARVDSLDGVNEQALLIVRDNNGGLSMTRPIVEIQLHDGASTADILHYFSFSGNGDITLNSHGGIGLFSAVGGSAPRTLAQSVITAITDANAQTAVQALANALSDMGALTLT